MNPDEVEHHDNLDPVYRTARREATIILCTWLVCLAWTVGSCWTNGYTSAGQPLSITWGIPTWVFWGILVPWFLATAWSISFGLFFMKEQSLEPTPGDRPIHEVDGESGESRDG